MSWLTKLDTKDFRIVSEDGFTSTEASQYRGLPRTRYGYNASVHGGLESNVVMAPIHWITRNFTEATPIVQRRVRRSWHEQEGHALANLMRRPNPFYSGNMLWKATLLSLLLDGNGYWRKIRNSFGGVLEYWYIPHFAIEPKWPSDGSTFVSHYEYRPYGSGPKIDLSPRDVAHFRFGGLDPDNTRKGLSPVRPLLREIFTDEEASNFSASILRNMGVPGGVIAPKDASALPKAEDVKAMKEHMKTGFTGDRRGDWLVLGTPTHIEQFGFDPQSLMLGNLRDIAEERVCAMLGVPAAVVGFGAGLQQTKVGATMRELRQSAWHNCIIPIQTDLAEQAGIHIMPDFVAQTDRYRVHFDRSGVSAFEEDKTEVARRVGILVEQGVVTVARGQELVGEESDESQRVYLRPSNRVAVNQGDSGVGAASPQAGEGVDDVPQPVAARMNGAASRTDEQEG